MANFEKPLKTIVRVGEDWLGSYTKFLGYIVKKFKTIKAAIYNGSSEFTKRSISGVMLLLFYFVTIIAGGSFYSLVVFAVAMMAAYESANVVVQNSEPDMVFKNLKSSFIVVGMTFGSLLLIRFSGQGAKVTLWLFLVVASVDTIAYSVGKWLGRTQIFPSISPGKTLEGAIGGSVGALIVSMLSYVLLSGYNNGILKFMYFILVSVMVILGAQIGDALQSMVKRHFGVKDMGNVIPGHGGIMDRMDSFIVAAPLAFVLVTLVNGQLF